VSAEELAIKNQPGQVTTEGVGFDLMDLQPGQVLTVTTAQYVYWLSGTVHLKVDAQDDNRVRGISITTNNQHYVQGHRHPSDVIVGRYVVVDQPFCIDAWRTGQVGRYRVEHR
jgi:hypothetical protein